MAGQRAELSKDGSAEHPPIGEAGPQIDHAGDGSRRRVGRNEGTVEGPDTRSDDQVRDDLPFQKPRSMPTSAAPRMPPPPRTKAVVCSGATLRGWHASPCEGVKQAAFRLPLCARGTSRVPHRRPGFPMTSSSWGWGTFQ